MAELSSYAAVTDLAGTDRIPVITNPGVAGGNKWITAANLAASTPFDAIGGGLEGIVVTTATGDGTTNDLAQLRLDMTAAAGQTLYLPPGTYKVASTIAAETFLAMTDGMTLQGAGSTVTEIVISASETGYHAFMTLFATKVKIKGITFRRASNFGCVMMPLGGALTGLLMEDCVFEGNMTTYAEYCHGIMYPNSGTVSNVNVLGTTFNDMAYPILQDNASTATVFNVRYDRCRLTTRFYEAILFNAPNSTQYDVAVTNCHIVGIGAGIDLAHVRGAMVANNYIETTGEAIHIEDYTSDVSVVGNTMHECNKVAGSAVIEVIDSHNLKFVGNSVTNLTAVTVGTYVVQVLGDTSGTTVGGRAKLNATHDISFVGNAFQSGPNRGVWAYNVKNFICNDNDFQGGLSIGATPTYTESGTNIYTGCEVIGGSSIGLQMTGNLIAGYRYATHMTTNTEQGNAIGTVISGNLIRECRYGIIGRSSKTMAITGNTITRCIHPMAVGAHGGGSGGPGCDPYSIVGNTMNDNKYRASIDGVVVIVSAGTATIGSGVTLTISPLLLDLISNRAITFSGGGILTTTTIGVSDATSLVGNLTVANIASGEYAIVTGLVDRPHEAPYTVNNHVIAGNTDSVLATYMTATAATISGLGSLATATTLNEYICVALSDETTAITTGVAKATFRMPFAMTVTAVKASLTTASSSGIPTVDINDGGTTILSTKLTIDASELTSATAATAAVISDTALASDAEITFDIDVAGTGAKGLKAWIIGTRTV